MCIRWKFSTGQACWAASTGLHSAQWICLFTSALPVRRVYTGRIMGHLVYTHCLSGGLTGLHNCPRNLASLTTVTQVSAAQVLWTEEQSLFQTFSCDQNFKNYYIVNLPTFQPFTLVLNASTFPWSHINLVDWQEVGTAATLFPIHSRSHTSSISAKPTRLQPIVFL